MKRKRIVPLQTPLQTTQVSSPIGPTGDEIWETDISIIKPVVLIDLIVLGVCKEIDQKYSDTEFSILFKGKYTEKGFLVTGEYYIPRQKVGYSSVDYLEDLARLRLQQGYNTVLHKHPGASTGFSVADEEYLNRHFTCSLLYAEGNIVKAEMTVNINDTLRLAVEAKIEAEMPSVEINGIDNIEKDNTIYPVYSPRRYRTPYDKKDKKDSENEADWDYLSVYDRWGLW